MQEERVQRLQPNTWLTIGLFSLFCLGIILLWGDAPYVDESHHFGQITQFLQGNYTVRDLLTVIPGYHAAVAFIMQFMGFSSLAAARGINLVISLFTLFAVWRTTGSSTKTAQWALLPLAFPYAFLVYTDQLSALSVLAVWYFLQQKKQTTAGLVGLAAVLIRQTNILWVGGLWAISLLQKFGTPQALWGALKTPSFWRKNAAALLPTVPILWLLIMNGGLVLGDKTAHAIGVFPENPLYFLIMICLLFWPILFQKTTKPGQSTTPWWWLAVGGALLCYVLLWDPTHPYNSGDYFIRNIALRLTQESMWAWSMGALFTGFGTYVLSRIHLKHTAYYWLYPLIFIALSLQELVETRYYILPFLFIILLRKSNHKLLERGLCGWWAILSFALLIIMFGHHSFFL